jgi:hypothetical protein
MQRLSVRFRNARPRTGPRYQLVLWGGPRMSLFPRYADLPHAGRGDLAQDFSAWMLQWPEVADTWGTLSTGANVRVASTRRMIDLPGERVHPAGIAPRELAVALDEDERRLVLRAAVTGERLRPVFFGVSRPRALSSLVTLLCHLAGFDRSFLDVACDAVNAIHFDRATASRITRLPELQLGDAILLSPETFVLPAEALAGEHTPVDRRGFFRVHDLLESHGLPRGLVQVRADLEDREPAWLDLEHPEGVNALLRIARCSTTVSLSPPVADEDAGVRANDGTYDVEYYAEIAAGTALGRDDDA